MRNHSTVVIVDNKYAYRELNIFEGENKDGNCYGRYNPQELPKSHKINFDWVLYGSEENRIKILEEIERLAF